MISPPRRRVPRRGAIALSGNGHRRLGPRCVEALQGFLTAAPTSGGMAYVVIQHLSPEHKTLMADLLSRCTPMPLHQIEEGMRLAPDDVCVIRPGRTVTLRDGRLRMGESLEKGGHRRPVDDFLRSPARDRFAAGSIRGRKPRWPAAHREIEFPRTGRPGPGVDRGL